MLVRRVLVSPEDATAFAMPEFGNFQTILTLSTDDARSVYLTHRRGEPDGPKYIVVVFRVRKATEQYERDHEGIRNLGQDLQLAFISALKTQKAASDGGSPFVARIYELGINFEGAWYATDHFPRGSLRNWIAQKHAVDDQSLRSIFGFCIAGLCDLKRLSGRSHGDLKASKLFLPGKSSRSRNMGVQITEPLSGSEMDAEYFERADLHALGALLYQLVCLEEVQRADEIKYPVTPTNHWDRLGTTGEYWLKLCNKLLANPPQCSLESLAEELPPPLPTPKWKIYAAAAALILAIVGVGLHFSPALLLPTDSLKSVAVLLGNTRASRYLQTKSEYVDAINQARDQAEMAEFENAREWLTNAVSLQFREAEAERLLQAINAREARFNQYLAAIPQLIAQTRYADAVQACSQARRLAPRSARIDHWESKASQLAEAMQDFKEGHYGLAERKFDQVWKSDPQDSRIKDLRDKSARCLENWDLFERTKESKWLEVVLGENPSDQRAQSELKQMKITDADYREHLEDARAFFEAGNYAAAAREFEWAVSARNEPESKTRFEESKNLERLRERADGFYLDKQWAAAVTNYAEIFRHNAKDAGVAERIKECQRALGGQ